MTAASLLGLYGLTAASFLAIDLVWLGLVAPDFYQRHIGALLRTEIVWSAAALFYLVYVAGVVVFAVLPALEDGSLLKALLLGAGLGFFAYATFDLTSMALLEGFSWTVVVVDLVWGTVLTAAVAAAGFGFGRWLGLEV